MWYVLRSFICKIYEYSCVCYKLCTDLAVNASVTSKFAIKFDVYCFALGIKLNVIKQNQKNYKRFQWNVRCVFKVCLPVNFREKFYSTTRRIGIRFWWLRFILWFLSIRFILHEVVVGSKNMFVSSIARYQFWQVATTPCGVFWAYLAQSVHQTRLYQNIYIHFGARIDL